MLERNRPYLVEGFKSMLIFLLAMSAIFLAGKAFMPYGESGEKAAGDLLPLTTAEPLSSVGVSRPIRMAVVNANGRCGVQYDDLAVDPMFDELGDLLGEALGSAGVAVPVDREVWEEALEQQGVYYDFPGMVSLSLLSAWLGEGEASVDAYATAILLSAEEDGDVRLYYADANSEDYYACSTLVEFRQRLEGYAPNGAFFAFQQPEHYGGLDPNTLILPEVPSPALYEGSVGVNVQDSAERDALLDALSVDPQPNAIYPAADGWNVRDGEDSVRLTNGGSVYYHGGETSDRYPLPAGAGQTELVEMTGELVRRVLSSYCGDARIYLDQVDRQGEKWTLTYRYSLSGAEVQVGQEGWCAQFVVENGVLCEYTLNIRSYKQTADEALLLPEYQAMYAMQALEAEGRQLLLRYYDNGAGLVTPSWIAR